MTPPPNDAAFAIHLAETPVPDSVLEHILSRILDGTYGPGGRLPAERKWSAETGASRVSVRGALSRLAEWGVIEIRRGSGAVVRPRTEWRLDVLPAYLRHGAAGDGLLAVGQALMDLLEVRRTLLVHMVGKVAERVRPGTLDPARMALRRAAEARDDSVRFAELDVDMIRSVLSACGMTASVWVLNALADAYLRATREVPPTVVAAPRYLETHLEIFDLLEAGETQAAKNLLTAYLEAHDATILFAATSTARGQYHPPMLTDPT
jgi:DNA-binding FadR family transcriptional regulator